MKLYSALYNAFNPFSDFYPDAECEIAVFPEDLTSADGWLIIWGGSDIHPVWYGRENVASHVGHSPSERDIAEVALFRKAVEIGLPIMGVCRGAQLGCALSGGILIQDVRGHGRNHPIRILEDGRTITTSSLHHQMMYPWNTEHVLLADALPRLSQGHYQGLTDEELEDLLGGNDEGFPQLEPEVVWFPKTKCLGVQGHPEFMSARHPFNVYVNELMERYPG